MQPEAKKTAICFHAKDDAAEVRREVFKILPSLNVRVIVAIRRKQTLVEKYRALFERYGGKFQPNEIYDEMISRIFRDKLHTADENSIVFARRGKAVREEALEDALIRARRNFETRWGKRPDRPTSIVSAYPSESVGLQVVDYYLWAVQRMFERGEERFFQLLAPQYRLIMDLDDTRNKPYGEWYSDRNPCELSKIMPVAS
jgi:CRISPR/Cas system-associated exonuclease Cas4 (RecB family)